MNATTPLPFSTWRAKQSHETIAECIDNCDMNWRCTPERPQCVMWGKVDDNNESLPCAVHEAYEVQLAHDTDALRRWGSE